MATSLGPSTTTSESSLAVPSSSISPRMYGPKFVQSMVSQKTYDKYINWLNEGKRFDRFFIFMMIWPISPADFLCMLAGLANMTFKRYMTIIILCKPITLVIYTYGLTLYHRLFLANDLKKMLENTASFHKFLFLLNNEVL